MALWQINCTLSLNHEKKRPAMLPVGKAKSNADAFLTAAKFLPQVSLAKC
jgi:hypothetical protein